MKILKTMRGAMLGWRAIVAGEADWARHFALTRAGLTTALVVYLLLAFVALVYGAGAGALNPISAVMGLFVLGLYVWALVISAWGTKVMLQWEKPIFTILVPGTYAMALFLVAGTLLASFGPAMIALAYIGIGLLLFRLGQVAGGWNIGISAAFAVLTAVLLVAMPMTLYMLASPATAPQ